MHGDDAEYPPTNLATASSGTGQGPVLPFTRRRLALLVAGVFISGQVGFVLMFLGAAFVGWVLFLSWPRLSGSERIMRFAVLLLALALALVQLFPRPAV